MQKSFYLSYLLFLFTVSLQAQKNFPNIIYILTDDLGYGDVSALNKDSKINTRYIDQIAKEGMTFTDAHSNSSVCTPTRYGVLTGRYAWRTKLQNGVLGGDSPPLISEKRSTVASLLKQKGYQTACIGKWHLGLGWEKDSRGKLDYKQRVLNGPVTLGFDYFFGIPASLDMAPYVYIENDKITATSLTPVEAGSGKGFWRSGLMGNDFRHAEVLPLLIEKTEAYIKKQAKSQQPFYLYLPLPSPHTPILPAREYRGKTTTNEYGDFVLMTDDMVGRVLRVVKEAGIENNTMIIFTSDNGVSPAANLEELKAAAHNSSYIFRGNKADIYEGGHRVPFIVKWPGKVRAGAICDASVCLTDFMATAADITNLELKDNEGEDSYSLLPLLMKKGNYKREYTVHHSIQGNFSIRNGNWKLAFSYGSGGWSPPKEADAKNENMPSLQLFNFQDDIGEKINVADRNVKVVNDLTLRIEAIISNGRSTSGARQSNDVPVNYLKYK